MMPILLGMRDTPLEEKVAEEFQLTVKSDDASVPVKLWDSWVWWLNLLCDKKLLSFRTLFAGSSPLDVIRAFLLCRWKWLVTTSLLLLLRNTYKDLENDPREDQSLPAWYQCSHGSRDIEFGQDYMKRAAGAT
jgi:hypothetical protein